MSSQDHISTAEFRALGGMEGLERKFRARTRGDESGRVRGEKMEANDIPTEHEEQVEFFRWAKGDENTHPWLPEDMHDLLWSNPNGGYRYKKTGGMMKAEGQMAGVPDITFAWSRLGYHALYIEMKRTKGGTLSDEQKRVIASLRWAGNLVVVCKGCAEAQEAMRAYMIGDGKEFD